MMDTKSLIEKRSEVNVKQSVGKRPYQYHLMAIFLNGIKNTSERHHYHNLITYFLCLHRLAASTWWHFSSLMSLASFLVSLILISILTTSSQCQMASSTFSLHIHINTFLHPVVFFHSLYVSYHRNHHIPIIFPLLSMPNHSYSPTLDFLSFSGIYIMHPSHYSHFRTVKPVYILFVTALVSLAYNIVLLTRGCIYIPPQT